MKRKMKMSLKDRETVEVTHNGIGFSGLLTILFIGLKLTGQIDWDWLWVLSPIWLPFTVIAGLIIVIAICVFMFGFLETFIGGLIKHNRKK
jgi:hypothetical protein